MTGAEIATTAILAASTVVLIAFDIWAAFGNRVPNERDTISGRLRDWGSRIAFLPLAWGVLAGHFWAPSFSPWLPQPWAALALAGAGVGVTSFHWFVGRRRFRFAAWLPLTYLAIGVCLGLGLWQQ